MRNVDTLTWNVNNIAKKSDHIFHKIPKIYWKLRPPFQRKGGTKLQAIFKAILPKFVHQQFKILLWPTTLALLFNCKGNILLECRCTVHSAYKPREKTFNWINSLYEKNIKIIQTMLLTLKRHHSQPPEILNWEFLLMHLHGKEGEIPPMELDQAK